MGSSFTTETDAPDVARRLAEAADRLDDLQGVNDAAAKVVEAAAKVPRVTGALAASLAVVATATGSEVTSSLRYATFVHWGAPRRHVRAQPFLLTALELKRAEVVDLYLEHMQETVNNV